MSSLEKYRQEIDRLDQRIVALLGRRFGVCRRVARFKKAQEIPMMQPSRVAHVKQRCRELAHRERLDPNLVVSIYDLIIAAACELEDEIIQADDGGDPGVQKLKGR